MQLTYQALKATSNLCKQVWPAIQDLVTIGGKPLLTVCIADARMDWCSACACSTCACCNSQLVLIWHDSHWCMPYTVPNPKGAAVEATGLEFCNFFGEFCQYITISKSEISIAIGNILWTHVELWVLLSSRWQPVDIFLFVSVPSPKIDLGVWQYAMSCMCTLTWASRKPPVHKQ